MASSSKNKNRNNQKSMKKNKKNNMETYIRKATFLHCVIFIFLSLLLIIVLVSYNIYNTSKNIEKMNLNILNLEQESVTLEKISPHYVFLGDSITEQYELSKYFKGYSVVNSGISGDMTDDILKNMEKRVYQYNPSTVFLMIGTNENRTADYVFSNIQKIVQEIQINLPNAKIIIESIIPSQENWGDNDKNETRRKINNLLYNEYKDSDIIYIDLYSKLSEEKDQKLSDNYTMDGLHLNDLGYEIVTKELKKYMNVKNN